MDPDGMKTNHDTNHAHIGVPNAGHGMGPGGRLAEWYAFPSAVAEPTESFDYFSYSKLVPSSKIDHNYYHEQIHIDTEPGNATNGQFNTTTTHDGSTQPHSQFVYKNYLTMDQSQPQSKHEYGRQGNQKDHSQNHNNHHHNKHNQEYSQHSQEHSHQNQEHSQHNQEHSQHNQEYNQHTQENNQNYQQNYNIHNYHNHQSQNYNLHQNYNNIPNYQSQNYRNNQNPENPHNTENPQNPHNTQNYQNPNYNYQLPPDNPSQFNEVYSQDYLSVPGPSTYNSSYTNTFGNQGTYYSQNAGPVIGGSVSHTRSASGNIATGALTASSAGHMRTGSSASAGHIRTGSNTETLPRKIRPKIVRQDSGMKKANGTGDKAKRPESGVKKANGTGEKTKRPFFINLGDLAKPSVNVVKLPRLTPNLMNQYIAQPRVGTPQLVPSSQFSRLRGEGENEGKEQGVGQGIGKGGGISGGVGISGGIGDSVSGGISGRNISSLLAGDDLYSMYGAITPSMKPPEQSFYFDVGDPDLLTPDIVAGDFDLFFEGFKDAESQLEGSYQDKSYPGKKSQGDNLGKSKHHGEANYNDDYNDESYQSGQSLHDRSSHQSFRNASLGETSLDEVVGNLGEGLVTQDLLGGALLDGMSQFLDGMSQFLDRVVQLESYLDRIGHLESYLDRIGHLESYLDAGPMSLESSRPPADEFRPDVLRVVDKHLDIRGSPESTHSESSPDPTEAKKKKKQKGAVCTVCNKFISRDISRHMRIHDDVGRFQCVYPKHMCNHKTQNFNRPYDYKKHLLHIHFKFEDPKGKTAHTLTDKLPLSGSCLACGVHFASANSWLEDHVLGSGPKCQYIEKR